MVGSTNENGSRSKFVLGVSHPGMSKLIEERGVSTKG